MGIQTATAESRNYGQTFTLEPANTFLDYTTTVAAADSFQMLGGATWESNQERVMRMDSNASRSYFESVARRRTNNFGFSTYFLPPGGATVPDIGPLLTAAMGVETVTTNVAYTLSDTLRSGVFHSVAPGLMGFHTYGTVVNTMNINLPDGDEPTIEWGLIPAKAQFTGRTTASGTVDGTSTPVTTLTLSEADAYVMYDVGSYVSVGTSNAHRVTGRTPGSNQITITPGVSTNEGSSPVIAPYTYYAEASIASANVLGMTQGSYDVGSATDVCFQSATISLNNNFTPINCYGSADPVDMSAGRREITGEVVLWARTPDILRAHLGRADIVADRRVAMTWVLGDDTQSGNPIVTISIPVAELDYPSYDNVDEGVNSINVPFRAFGSSGNDEMTITFGTSA